MGHPYAMGEIEKYLARWWFQPTWQNISQNGSFAQLGVKIENIWNHHLVGEYPPRKKQTTWDPPKSVNPGKFPSTPKVPNGSHVIVARTYPSYLCPAITKNFRYPKWRFPEPYDRLFWGWISPYISLTYSLYRWGFLHFRYLKSLVMLSL